MASNSFKVKNSLVLTPKDLATLVSPEAGDLACDINDSNKIKRYDVNSASWVEVGSGGGVGGTDIFFVQDFESASLASFTQTGLTLSQTDPLHGKVSALLTHQAGVSPTNDQKFKQVIPVDRKFRGESMTLRLNCKSSASAGNVTINIYDETNAANLVASEQLQLSNDVSGAISQVGFTIPATCASISYTITALPQSGSPVTRIDDVVAELAVTSLLETVVELTGNAQTLTIPLTQSGLVQEANSTLRMSNATASGNVISFSNIVESIGNDVSYSSGLYTIQTSGVYSIGAVVTLLNVDNRIHITKNSTTTTNTDSAVLSWGATHSTGGYEAKAFWTGPLVSGDVVRFTTANTISAAGSNQKMFITRQGSLKQVSVSPDQKITIPTSELRFEGASSRGTSPSNAIVKFDTLAKLRGDAFTVNNDPVLGTSIVMKKAGRLNISSSVYAAASSYIAITRNQATLTTSPTASETLAASGSGATGALTRNASWAGDVAVGDIVRIFASTAPSTANDNSLNLSFQEQEISVSVTNTLPQFSESDTSLRLSGAGASPFGSTATTTRRFASVLQNIGTDIEYIDSPTLGGQFIAKASGIYNVSYSEESSTNINSFYVILKINGTTVSFDNEVYNTASPQPKAASTSWSGHLTAGDVITASVAEAAQNNGASSLFTISKVGKPNVTGVNVTPFVNVPQPESQSSLLNQTTTLGAVAVSGALTSNTNNGIYRYDSTTGVYTLLKRATVNVEAALRTAAATAIQPTIEVNGVNLNTINVPAVAGFFGNVGWTGILSAGESFRVKNDANSSDIQRVAVTAEALSDQILTAPETFSTDTAALTYANAATYTLSTLANAPVGTYITFTYAANTNTRTQTTLTNRPTQTDADMNANGMLIYTRTYNAASTAAQPAVIAVQIGKGLKGKSLDLYKSAGKVTAGSLDYSIIGTTTDIGAKIYAYNESTGILIVDAGTTSQATVTTHSFIFSDDTAQTSGYLVINASKNPALTGIGLNRIAARAISTSGQSIPNGVVTAVTWNSAKTFDTTGSLNTATGVYTAPETGYYQVNTSILSSSVAWSSGQVFQVIIFKNSSAFSTTVLGIPAGTFTPSTIGNDLLFLAKGDTCSISVFHNRGAATALNNSTPSYFSIAKVSV